MRCCYLWEERLQGATVASTIRSILNAAMTCHGAHGGKTFRNTAWDHMTGCPTRFDADPPIEGLAYARNAGADETTRPPRAERQAGGAPPRIGDAPARLNPAASLHIIFRAPVKHRITYLTYQ